MKFFSTGKRRLFEDSDLVKLDKLEAYADTNEPIGAS